ncbi:MAG: DNA-binding response regulator [Rhodospirillales bacterium]|jgi:CheY-like chemotaxis protein|nr:DNA-binding response regulator [Rhodospirillales bacterium]
MSQILIVDDQESVRSSIRSLLEAAGHTVVDSNNGLAALELLTDGFDLVITDVMMPDMDGLELVQHVKRKFRNMPILAITGWSAEGVNLLAMATKLGADRALAKAALQDRLVPTVAFMLARRKPATQPG